MDLLHWVHGHLQECSACVPGSMHQTWGPAHGRHFDVSDELECPWRVLLSQGCFLWVQRARLSMGLLLKCKF